MTLNRVPEAADELAWVDQGINLHRLFGGHNAQLIHAHVTPAREGHVEAVHPLLRRRQCDPASDMEADVDARHLLNLFIKLDRILLQFGDVRVAVDRVEPACRVPG